MIDSFRDTWSTTLILLWKEVQTLKNSTQEYWHEFFKIKTTRKQIWAKSAYKESDWVLLPQTPEPTVFIHSHWALQKCTGKPWKPEISQMDWTSYFGLRQNGMSSLLEKTINLTCQKKSLSNLLNSLFLALNSMLGTESSLQATVVTAHMQEFKPGDLTFSCDSLPFYMGLRQITQLSFSRKMKATDFWSVPIKVAAITIQLTV